MKRLIKSLFTQQMINDFYHLPMAILANIVYSSPAGKLKVIGVTGTDGKTTTVNMIYRILKAAGKKVSMISTINAPGFHTTSPGPFTIQKFAKESVRNSDEYLVLEVTSHALDQFRFWGIKFDVGVVTNITHEHLDYHQTFENYQKTKLKLLKNARKAVVNKKIREYEDFRVFREKAITFGLEKGDFNQKELKLKLKVPGDYNIENALAALAVAYVLDIDKNVAQTALENFDGINGRMEEVKNKNGIRIFIDFAHTPNGLEQALKSLRSQLSRTASGRLLAIIGAEGDRDTGKRAMMGEIAQKLANLVIVTAVDPRGQLEVINKDIAGGAVKAGAKEGINFFVINDRTEAIELAVNRLAKKGDIVGIFGKGHETTMNLDGKEVPWSDKETVIEALQSSYGS
ncbi:hypothetical protein A3J19_05575 [Candidatus Daviesbacteria bacterium RIFCSPLOWO2_02_FULL_41_8]|uniref:UDP-N-acetylmuramoyl-L-alanyl-D-glutamate--2, 6-diaminopimelate ligase n=3 Tax=Candidatus Daviesiibacteriota TaxID=1752718 RepID=A0A1F5NID1_9BACT|nr:MAG: hypothetical protein A2871_03530 [Candidatus Daviesbacteria bacterium RIFCSPHIGHO2_01_FULL_41_23]OGE32470.1 MAG: hypothetical protein A3D83_02370 [Candidatus Daviesbacteria bacterium RIFCSPHIGHO2_02_FULL_41_10]OGE61991.1 MAG: hypothetical protein A2967_03345 [Candidatus Daviesbacteria bacterium RIFCSPLOWO2_01_FULL_41_32]OGE77378.1 MAG: hypothetical protein A3J19_05575 [Candidatus Daviesbacteria bacterium RIFCSPLOWO2_02_FULL_41_8]